VSINASFCFEKCDHGPTVSVDGHKIQHCTPQAAKTGLLQKLKERQEKQL
jgi:NADH:ubiquinone oxidoreductase subunit E